MSENPLLRLAEHAASLKEVRLAPVVEHHARRALVDWFASVLPGGRQSPAKLLAAALHTQAGAGSAIVYAEGGKATADLRHAAFINAVASHTVEFDDIHRDSGYHPAAPTIPAALAAAQAHGASLETLLKAIVAGYEVSCRIGLAVQPSHYRMWHTTGTVGTFGAATAAAFVLGADASLMAHANALAATMCGGLQQAFLGDGMSKPMHAGHAADAGVLAALAATAGVTGALDVLHGPAGFAAATSDSTGDWDRAFASLGRGYAIEDITFKNYGCCGHIFPALDAVVALKAAHGFVASDVAHIQVLGYRPTKTVCDRPDARSVQEARFSVQYCLAALLVTGGVRIAAFAPERLTDPTIRALMQRISVDLDPELADAYPARRPARVRIRLTDGREFERFQPTRHGDPDDPLTDDELSAKFIELTEPALGRATPAVLESLWRGTTLPGNISGMS